MAKKDITWAPHVPLIGGFPLGTEAAVGTKPEAIYSFPGFEGNDGLYVQYQKETLQRGEVEYIQLAPEEYDFERKINIIIGTPPCAGLSALNRGTTKELSGADATINGHIYEVFKQGMHKFNADAIIVENAPALSTKKGRPVADRLYKICEENDYSLTLYKTSTHFHGIPQRRDRTFVIAWRSKVAPILEYEKVEHKMLADYLEEIPEWASHQDEIIADDIPDRCGWWEYIKHKNPGKDPRDIMYDAGQKSAYNYMRSQGLVEEAAAWAIKNGTERQVHVAEHTLKKNSMGKGVWDSSINSFKEYTNATISRNMTDTIHPVEDRSLNVREAMHMMGLPHDFDLIKPRSDINKIAQNVPVKTATFISNQAIKFINGELPLSNSSYMFQNNWNGKSEDREAEMKKTTLNEFIG